jgi:hypothetical protein
MDLTPALVAVLGVLAAGTGRTSPPPGIAERALGVGAPAPGFELPAAAGERFTLEEARRKGPVVLIFYRGAW